MNNFKGYGFKPSDEELIGYLRDRTLPGCDCLVQDIIDLGVDICNFEPWDLPGCDSVTSSDPLRYFIYLITYKHPNSNRPKMIDMETGKRRDGKRKPMINRATNKGMWKTSGEPTEVKSSDSKVIGIKKRLYFKQNSYPNETSWLLHEFELTDVDPSQNKYFLGKLMMKQSKPTTISSSKGETSQQLPSIYSGNYHIPPPEVQVDFHQEPLVEMDVPIDYDWIQNQTSISEKTNDQFINSFSGFNYETCHGESSNPKDFVNDGNEVISNLEPSNLVADYAILHNLQLVDYTEPIKSFEVPNVGIGAQNQLYTNQHDQSFQNVLIDNDQTCPVERSNQHNVVAENEGFNLPSNFFNDPIADISQMNWYGFDDLYWGDGLYLHELFGVLEAPNNYDGVQNQYGINQQVADEFGNSNLIDNEIYQPDQRNKSAAAAETEGSNLSSLSMAESSYIMESVRKRSAMELEGSSTGIETELAQPQEKKSRFVDQN